MIFTYIKDVSYRENPHFDWRKCASSEGSRTLACCILPRIIQHDDCSLSSTQGVAFSHKRTQHLLDARALCTHPPATHDRHMMDSYTFCSEDVVLDVEASDVDCLYRIARRSDFRTRVVYVTICDADIIPETERTESSLILKNLREFPDWFNEDWHIMEVFKTQDGIHTRLDHALPHALPAEILLKHVPRYNFFDLELLGRSKHRTSRARIGGDEVFVKISPFSYQLGYLRQEVTMYHHLSIANSPLVPELLGYVYEEIPDRIIGFLCQAIPGRHPLAADYDTCLDALKQIHATGVIHGDINKYNILITPTNKVVFIDLENSRLTMTSGIAGTEMATEMEKENKELKISLSDRSNRGRPLDTSD
jgi:hypothetical protein